MNRRIFSTILALTFPIAVFGQRLGNGEPMVDKSISLDDAIVFANMNNHSVSAAQSGIDAAIHRKKAAWGLGVPKLSVGANYTYMSQGIGNLDFNPQKDQFVNFLGNLPIPLPPDIITGLKNLDLSYTLQKRDFGTVDASLIVPIFTGGKISAANKAAKIGILQAQNDMSEVRGKLFVEVTEFYWGLALAYNLESLQGGLVESMELHAKNATMLEKNGIIAHGEKLFAEMALSQAKAAFTTSQNNTKTVNTALSGTLSERGNYKPITPLFINRNLESLEFFQQQTAMNSDLLEKVELIKQLGKQAVRAEKSNFFPTVGAVAVANVWNYNLTNQLPRWLAGATVTWNLFNGLTREQNFAAAKDQVRQVEALQAKAEIDIATLVEKLYNQTKSAIEMVDASEATIAFAREYVAIQQKAFAEGMATSVNVVDAQLNLNKALVERMAAAYSYDVSLAQLLALSGMSQSFSEYQMGDGYQEIEN